MYFCNNCKKHGALNETVHSFYRKKTAPTVDVIYDKLKEIYSRSSYEFLYGPTTLKKT